MTTKNTKTPKKAKKEEVKTLVGTRGRSFEGVVIKKFSNRVVIEFERTVYVKKYQRFYIKKTNLHARLPEGMSVELGDYIKIKECRPLSKIIHAIVVEKIRSKEAKQ